MDRIKLYVAVHLLLIHKNKILLLKRFQTGYEDGNYSVIAGHIRQNESVIEAMMRESFEEADIKIEIEDLDVVQVMHRKKSDEERIDYFFSCKKWTGIINNKEPSKCSELAWFELNGLPGNTIGYIKCAIENYLNNTKFTFYGW